MKMTADLERFFCVRLVVFFEFLTQAYVPRSRLCLYVFHIFVFIHKSPVVNYQHAQALQPTLPNLVYLCQTGQTFFVQPTCSPRQASLDSMTVGYLRSNVMSSVGRLCVYFFIFIYLFFFFIVSLLIPQFCSDLRQKLTGVHNGLSIDQVSNFWHFDIVQ